MCHSPNLTGGQWEYVDANQYAYSDLVCKSFLGTEGFDLGHGQNRVYLDVCPPLRLGVNAYSSLTTIKGTICHVDSEEWCRIYYALALLHLAALSGQASSVCESFADNLNSRARGFRVWQR